MSSNNVIQGSGTVSRASSQALPAQAAAVALKEQHSPYTTPNSMKMQLLVHCRSTNTSPGGPSISGPGLRQAILARSASQALAAQAAAAALKRQTSTQSSLNTGASLTPKPSGAMTPQTSLQLSPPSSDFPAGVQSVLKYLPSIQHGTSMYIVSL